MRTLLLADDSVTIQRVIALTFANEEFRVITVSGGQQAIDRIKAQPPDIVLAGTTMPNLDGYDVSRYVRSQPGLKNVPVLLLTGAFESVDEARLEACGASGTIEKPFEPTIVISRVKELLGLKATPTPATGRSVTPANSPAGKRPPRPPVVTSKPAVPAKPGVHSTPDAAHTPAPAKTPAAAHTFEPAKTPPGAQPPEPPKVPVSALTPAPAEPAEPTPALAQPAAPSWDDVPDDGSLDPGTSSVDSAHGADRADYLDSLDAAFDTLDARLQTREGDESAVPRNPDAPQRQPGPADPRSPGRLPAPSAKAGDAHSVFEVDDEWFAEGNQARPETQGATADRQLAAEMGIHEVELPESTDGLHAAPAKDLDFDFGLDADVRPQGAAIDVHDEMSQVVAVAEVQAPVEMPSFEEMHESAPVLPVLPVLPAQSEPLRPNPQVADAFAALLAREQGEPQALPEPEEPPPAPVIVQAAAPEITDAMLDQIAERVAERLNVSLFADHFRAAMASTVRDTVRSVVSETSEKLVRDEIARVKAQAERDTQ